MAAIGIQVRDLRKRFKAVQALDGVTTDFEPGLLHGVIGPDGAGKTTLLRTLMGLLRPTSGEVTFTRDGRPVPFNDVRPQFAYLPQSQSLYPDLSCGEHLDFFGHLYQIPADVYRRRRAELLHIARLEPFQDRRAGQLSGGMYKKLGLICALLQSPTVILLDEPTNGVDPVSRREFWDLLYRLLGENILILMSTAYMDEAERCGRVHLLEKGRLLADGDPHTILEREKADHFDEIFLRLGREERT
jgi:ABC-2 type transport system ATP-binding protein